MNANTRLATQQDTASIVGIFNSARAGMDYLPKLHTKEEDFEFFNRLVKDELVSVTESQGKIVGFIVTKEGWLEHLYISPEAQGGGFGKILLDTAKAENPNGLQLWVFEDNKGAIHFYERESFVLREQRDQATAENEEHLADRRYEWRPEPR